ncbi:MAG: ABC transporter permease [Coriobacteriales bacterium]|jgi:putative spermidine/putrescine transport system permease protein
MKIKSSKKDARGGAVTSGGIERRHARNKVAPIILLLPLAFLLIILLFGFVYGFLQSFGLLMPGKFAQGFTLDYYEKVLSDDSLGESILLSIYHSGVSSVIATVLAVVLSYALVATGHDRGAVWSTIKFPMFLPWTVTAMIAIDLFGGGGLMESIGEALSWDWLANISSVFLYQPSSIGIIVAFVWAEIPFISYFIVTVMSNINSSLGEAARTMGATSNKAFLNVTLPLCMPIIKNVFLIVATSLFSAYEIPLLLGVTKPTGIAVNLYQTYTHASLAGRPEVMAMSMIVLLVSLAFIVVFYFLFQRKPKYEREQARGGRE